MSYPEKLILVRHGQSEANLVQKNLIPRPDNFHERHDTHMRLSKEGIRQAQITGQWFKENNIKFDRHYVSPLIRTVETAVNLNLTGPWKLEDLIRERDWGEYGTFSYEEQEELFTVSKMLKNQFAWYWKPQGGEGLATGVRLRAETILTRLNELENVRNVILVSHGEFISVTRFLIENLTPYEWVEKDKDKNHTIHNAMVYEYSRTNPSNPRDKRDFYTWRRATCPWDTTKSHDNGEWVEIANTEYTTEDMEKLIQQYKPFGF